MTGHNVRPAEPADVEILVELCAEHAHCERAPYDAEGKLGRLRVALFGAIPKVRAWVATVQDKVVGYATATEDFSTWNAASFLHMDCLFVRSRYRNAGIGAALLRAVAEYARDRNLHEVQWQTPAWNADACRFYQRHGAVPHEKSKFSLSTR